MSARNLVGIAAVFAMTVALAGPVASQPGPVAESIPIGKFSVEAPPGSPLAKATGHLLAARALAEEGLHGAELEAASNGLLFHDGKIRVEVVFTEWNGAAAAAVEAAGLDAARSYPDFLLMTGMVDLADLAAVGAVAEVELIRPEYGAATNAGVTTSQADGTLEVDLLRMHEGVDGTGIEIGVMSDSFNKLSSGATSGTGCGRTTTSTASQVSGDLPATVGNLAPDPTSFPPFIDEGRGMMELIHDLAPGADLTFRTAFEGQADFANGIGELVACGADIVVDDIIYYTAPMFQDGLVAQAADAAAAAGVPYFSSAGNQGRVGADQPYRDSAAADEQVWPATGDDLHDWDPGAAIDTWVPITVPNNAGLRLVLQWNQPFTGSLGPGSAVDLDLYACTNPGLPCTGFTSADVQGCSTGARNGDPLEYLYIAPAAGPRTFYIGVDHYCGDQDGTHFRLSPSGVNRSITGYTFGTTNTGDAVFDQAQIYGHPAAADASAVAAVYYGEIDNEGGLAGGLDIDAEAFTSLGGDLPFYFDGAGAPLPGAPQYRAKPEIAAPDGTNTSFFGSSDPPCCEGDGFPNFFGTSAAAPHAAALAALLMEAQPHLDVHNVYGRLEHTAVDIETGSWDPVAGHGLIDGLGAAAAIDHVYLGNINSHGGADIAAIYRDPAIPRYAAVIKDSLTGATVASAFCSGCVLLDVEPLDTGPGAKVALLHLDTSDSSVSAFVWDPLGPYDNWVEFGTTFEPFDLEVIAEGTVRRVVLAGRKADGSVWGIVRNAGNGALVKNVRFGTALEPVDMEVLAGSPDSLALLGTLSTGKVLVAIRDSVSGALLRNVKFGRGIEPVDLEPVVLGSGPQVAMLGYARANGKTLAVVSNATTGARINTVKYGPSLQPLDLEAVVDAGADNLVLLARRTPADAVWVIERDAGSGALVRNVVFGKNVRPFDIEVSGASGAGHYAVLATTLASGDRVIHVREKVTHVLAKVVAL